MSPENSHLGREAKKFAAANPNVEVTSNGTRVNPHPLRPDNHGNDSGRIGFIAGPPPDHCGLTPDQALATAIELEWAASQGVVGPAREAMQRRAEALINHAAAQEKSSKP